MVFEDLYTGNCSHCGEELNWEFDDYELHFLCVCSCGAEYILTPTEGELTHTMPEADEYDED